MDSEATHCEGQPPYRPSIVKRASNDSAGIIQPVLIHRRRRTVFLRHTLEDGSWHIDWMYQRAGHDEAPLQSFRSDAAPWEADTKTPWMAVSAPDHRCAYLDYEGPVRGGRGSVVKLAGGWVFVHAEAPGALTVDLDIVTAGGVAWHARLQGTLTPSVLPEGSWAFQITAALPINR